MRAVARIGRGLAMAAALACGGLRAPEVEPTDAAALERARATLEEAVARRGDLRLVEGGLVVHAFVYEPRASLLWELPEPHRPDGMLDPADPYVVQEETLVGPREVYVALDELRAVWVRSWTFGAGVELELGGDPERVVLHAADRAEAEGLAAAIEHLRRGAHEEPLAPR